MLIFFGSFEIIAVLFVFIALLSGGASFIVNAVPVFLVLFMVKNLIQTVAIGHCKWKTPLSLTLAYLAIDTARMWIFFGNLRKIGLTFLNATGMRYFSALFGLILYFILCGGLFGLGEIISSLHHSGNKDLSKKSGITIDLFLLLLLGVVAFIGYL